MSTTTTCLLRDSRAWTSLQQSVLAECVLEIILIDNLGLARLLARFEQDTTTRMLEGRGTDVHLEDRKRRPRLLDVAEDGHWRRHPEGPLDSFLCLPGMHRLSYMYLGAYIRVTSQALSLSLSIYIYRHALLSYAFLFICIDVHVFAHLFLICMSPHASALVRRRVFCCAYM